MKSLHSLDVANWGRAWGWKLEGTQHVLAVQSCLDAGSPIAFYQDAGRTDWHRHGEPWPEHFTRHMAWPMESEVAAVIAITDRRLPESPNRIPIVCFRPPSLALGIHSAGEFTQDELMESIVQVFTYMGLSALSLTALASDISLKNHPELIETAEALQVPLLAYPPAVLARLPKEVASRAGSPCALAAILAAGASSTLAEPVELQSFTLSVARRTWEEVSRKE